MKFNCDGCGACCRIIPNDVLTVFNLPISKTGGCGNLVDNKCIIYESRPDICNVRTMWEKFYQSKLTWEEYCNISLEMCDLLKKIDIDNSKNK